MNNDKPWLEAVEGEAWELYFYHDSRPVVAVVKRVLDPHSEDMTYSLPSSLMFVGESYNNRVTADEIETGKRIWPAAAPSTFLDPLPFIASAMDPNTHEMSVVSRGASREVLKDYAIVTFRPRPEYEQNRVYYLWRDQGREVLPLDPRPYKFQGRGYTERDQYGDRWFGPSEGYSRNRDHYA